MRGLSCTALASAVFLAACGGAPDRTDDAREAEGEVLGGSISDDMLPLDQLQSQSPPMREERTTTTTDEDGNTSVETTVEVTSGEGAENQPAPPQPPAPPGD